MTTKLETNLYRSIGLELPDEKGADRECIIGLEVVDGKPRVSLRLKGLRTGWYFDIEEFARFATSLPRKPGDEWKLRINQPEKKN
jgi:hypothetical protein